MAPKVDFFFDIVCPYAYLASRRLPALVQARGAQLTWRPVLLGGLYAKTGAPQGAGGSASDAMPAAKQRVVAADLARCAAAQGATLQEHQLTTRPSTLLAMRILTAAPAEAVPTLAAALFTAYWEQGRDLSIGEELARVVDEAVHGVDGGLLVASTDALAVKELLRRNTDDAHEKFGVFGVPAFAVGDVDPSHPLRGKALHDAEAAPPKRGHVLIYGQDRLNFVDALLDPNYSPDNSPKYSPSPLSPTPLLTPLPPTAPGARIELFHDFSSPWSYLGYTQVHRILSRRQVSAHLGPFSSPFSHAISAVSPWPGRANRGGRRRDARAPALPSRCRLQAGARTCACTRLHHLSRIF